MRERQRDPPSQSLSCRAPWAGTIGYAAMATAVAAGYAAASTDTGHSGGSVMFVVGHPEKLVDFAYRAVHEMTVAAKAVTAGYYGQAPKHSYFNGCSTGGRQAIAEAQRFPGDYDGIIAGDPDFYATHIQAAQLFIGQSAPTFGWKPAIQSLGSQHP